MISIGNIIEEYRIINNMTRRELSEDICTEKYIYLIETDKRTPSANIIKLLSDRLGVDLFSYYEYFDCDNPILVKKLMEEFTMYRAKFEPQLLHESTIDAMKLPDFNKKPWSFEIRINDFFQTIYVKHEYKESIIEISKFLENIEPKYLKGKYVANAYILLSSSYIFLEDFQKAKEASLSAYEVLGDKYNMKSYENTITNIKINIMTLSYNLEEYDNVIHESKEILKYKSELASYDRIHYCFFYSAFAYEEMGSHHEAMENFKKGIYLCLVNHLAEDVKYITMQDIFPALLNDKSINKEIVSEFKRKYNVIEASKAMS